VRKFGYRIKYRKIYSKIGIGGCRKVGRRRLNIRGPLVKFVLFGKEFSSDNAGDGPKSDASSSAVHSDCSDSDCTLSSSSSSNVSSPGSFCGECSPAPTDRRAAAAHTQSTAGVHHTPQESKNLFIRRKSHQVAWNNLSKEHRVLWANNIMSQKCGCKKNYCLLDTDGTGKASIIINARDSFMSLNSSEFYNEVAKYFDMANVYDEKSRNFKPNSSFRIGKTNHICNVMFLSFF